MTDRIVVLLDMDCFYVQVEERDHPNIKGVPAAVVQYNSWKGGGIIAVNYEARAFGVKRGMRGDEARSKCADIHLVQVPVNRSKADLSKYRDAGKEVIKVLCEYSDCVERASIDEAYIELTKTVEDRIKKNNGKHITDDILKSSWIVGYDKADMQEDQQVIREKGVREWLGNTFDIEEDAAIDASHPQWNDVRLAYAAVICEEMRAEVLKQTGFKCSAGIAHNKMLGKLSCGLHKPNQQTVLPQDKVPQLWDGLPVGKVRNLGGKLGDTLTEELGCNTMGDLARLSIQQLLGRYDNKTAYWLFNLGKGVDTEQVTSRQLAKSIGCGKNFNGKEILNTQEKVKKWMRSLADELSERLELDQTANKRRAKNITVGVRLEGDERWSSLTRSCSLPSYSAERITQVALSLIQPTNQASPKDSAWTPAIRNISLSAGKFEDWAGASSGNIQEMFKKVSKANASFAMQSQSVSSKESFTNANSSRSQQSSHNLTSAEENTPVPKGNEEMVIERKLASQTNLDKKKQECNNGTSNSFFKNFMLRRQQMKVADVSEEREFEVNKASTSAEENEEDGSAEECENGDLDMLVNQLDDNINESGDNSDDDSIYEASTDIDSSAATQTDASQDLFKDYDADQEIKSTMSLQGEISLVGNDPLDSFQEPNSVQGTNEIVNRQTSIQDHDPLSMEEAGGSKISVAELFPDLDNIDESLLPMLPNDLRIEVEKALEAHKAKKQVQEKKSGLWKYVTSSPSKNILSPSKKSLGTDQADCVSVTPKKGMFVQHDSPQSVKSVLTQNIDAQRASTSLPIDGENAEIQTSKEIKPGPHSEVSDDMMECKECGTLISIFDMPEHLDYHVALQLQTDIRHEMQHNTNGVAQRSTKDLGRNFKGKKRGRPSKGDNVRKNSKIQKLDSFFTQ